MNGWEGLISIPVILTGLLAWFFRQALIRITKAEEKINELEIHKAEELILRQTISKQLEGISTDINKIFELLQKKQDKV